MDFQRWISFACLLGLALVGHAAEPADDERLLKDAAVGADGPTLVNFFKQRIVGAADENKIRALVKQLGDDEFSKREEATQQLIAVGSRARPFLRQALTETDIEVKRRAEDCLKKIDQGAAGTVVAAGVRMLARLKPPGAVEVLLSYLPASEDEVVAEEVRAALAALAVRDLKADPALVAALSDALPGKRAAAGVALCRANAPGQMAAIRKLLDDPEPIVRMRVALALAVTREKEAVPVLISLLARVDARDRATIDALLHRLAEDKAPNVPSGADDAARKKQVDAWMAWWKEAGEKLDPARLAESARTLNYTLVVLLDLGRIVYLDERNHPAWQIENLEFPLDAQLLPGERVLVAEHNGNRITERNKKNEVIWEKKLEAPLVAQRLPNGNTFIATRTSLLELDKTGKEIFNYQRPGGELIMKAQKLRNGDIACVTQLGVTRYVRMDSMGKELKSFGVDLRSSGGRIDVLPNGNVLIPEMGNNRVAEHDADGKVVWEAAVEQPIAAIRLPGGTTLITSMNQNRALEVDRTGKEVWTYKTDTRVTRAFRE